MASGKLEKIKFKCSLSKENLRDVEVLASELSIIMGKHIPVSLIIDTMIEQCIAAIKEKDLQRNQT